MQSYSRKVQDGWRILAWDSHDLTLPSFSETYGCSQPFSGDIIGRRVCICLFICLLSELFVCQLFAGIGTSKNKGRQPSVIHLLNRTVSGQLDAGRALIRTQPESRPIVQRLISKPREAAWPYITVEGKHGSPWSLCVSKPWQRLRSLLYTSDHGVPSLPELGSREYGRLLEWCQGGLPSNGFVV